MIDFNQRYRLKPGLSVVAHSPDIVELRSGVWNPLSITLSDKTASGKLFQVLSRLDGSSTLAQLREELGLSKGEIEALVTYLEQYDAVETGATNIFDYQVQLMRSTLGVVGPSQGELPPLLVLGDEALGEELIRQLDGDFSQLSFLASSREPLLQQLAQEDFTLSEDPLALARRYEDFRAWEKTLVVAAFENINPIVLRNLNRLALHFSFPWIHAALDGPLLLVGPTFLPHRSPCYDCFEGRIGMNIRESGSYQRYKQALAEGKVKLGNAMIPRPIRSLLSSLTAFEVLNYAATGSCFTAGKVLSVYLPTLAFSFNEILRLPGCAACSPIDEQHEQGLYFHVKGFVNDMYSR
ncbi:MAG: TOMM precursor leader peptide-binding protein [Thermoanaerobaculia bacterium]